MLPEPWRVESTSRPLRTQHGSCRATRRGRRPARDRGRGAQSGGPAPGARCHRAPRRLGCRDRVVQLPGHTLERRADEAVRNDEQAPARGGARARALQRHRPRSISPRSSSGSTPTRSGGPSSPTSTPGAFAKSSDRPSRRGSGRDPGRIPTPPRARSRCRSTGWRPRSRRSDSTRKPRHRRR